MAVNEIENGRIVNYQPLHTQWNKLPLS